MNMLYLREATKEDRVLVLSWRSNPLVYQGTYSQTKPLTRLEHEQWWESREDCQMFMICLVEGFCVREVGYMNISPLQYWSPEIGIIIGEVSLWNQGIGTLAFQLGLDFLKSRGYQYTMTTVLDSNIGAIKMLKKLGFKRTSKARKGESRYEKELY